MGSRGRPFFDLNEPPSEEEEGSNAVLCCQPQKLLNSAKDPSSNLFAPSEGCQRVANNHGFSHASSVSGFQPFVRVKDANSSKENAASKVDRLDPKFVSSSSSMKDNCGCESTTMQLANSGDADGQAVEREEGEWLDKEGNADVSNCDNRNMSKNHEVGEVSKVSDVASNDVSLSECSKDEALATTKEEITHTSSESVPELVHENSKNFDCSVKRNAVSDVPDETSSIVKPKCVKGFEANHALKCANNPVKRNKLDEHKEAMLGKKRNRQTMFLNLEDVKQAGPMKTSTPRRQPFSSSLGTRTVKEIRTIPAPPDRMGDKQMQPTKDYKQSEAMVTEGSNQLELSDYKAETNGDLNHGYQSRLKKLNSSTDLSGDINLSANLRQGLWKVPAESRLLKSQQVTAKKLPSASQSRELVETNPGNKKHLASKKQNSIVQYQDTSVERLIREVTNEKFWHHPEETELQCVPGKFESVEEYVRVFEPLLFEECRAQLYSTWEELTETVSRDAHIMVRIKGLERRERELDLLSSRPFVVRLTPAHILERVCNRWYDVIVLPVHDCKWKFKEGDVGVLSTPKPGTARLKRKTNTGVSEDDIDSEVMGKVAGTVRRHIPIDTRDPPGAILHFYVGDDSNSKVGDDHVLRKLKGVWYLTILGSLATTQREYVALHAFRRLNLQMQTAILKPSPEQFPKYEEQPPAMPECFTQNFVEHLHRTFNEPQLGAIQWAAMHTAAGTSSAGMSKKQEPWPFTLVQGPPGTGKTHTVWGMLNVIHLVQYQHYYTALLKKLAPESYKQSNESNSDSVSTGSIDEVLQSMDQNLFRTLPKLCPKPRMLVCAPSNAATDELLARVLDRGFIDGEMKVYRPDVARVGVDSQTRAAQAVSVERRTEQLLLKSREEVIGWMHQLKARESQLSQQIALLQRELNVTAAAGRSQGSVGVDPEVLVAQDQNRDALLQNLAAAVEGRDKVLVEMSRLLILEGRFRAGSNFNLEDARSNLEASFANEAEIVFTTVSSSGRKLFSRLTHGFDMVVIDEAAQASEMAVLPPLALGAARCVLVGDPQQLPATVISKAAGTLLYSRSLFERFQQAGCPTMLLSVQYRMHPQIRDFPSRYFYQGRLTDSESVANLPDEIYYKETLLKPYVFFDVTHGRESHRGGSVSYQNIHEAQFCLRMYEHLQKTLKSYGVNTKVSVGIITPYKLQLKCLQREFEEVINSEEGKELYINTVDAFQGQERDVIIMSCVRASNHGVGFVADVRRMNVALTRARRALWVMGNANALMQSEDWAALITDAKTRNCFMDMDSLPKEFLGSKVPPSYTSVSGRGTPNVRGARLRGPRHNRQFDMHPSDSRSGTPSEDDEKSNLYLSKNGSYRNPKLTPMENSLDEFESQKRQNTGGVLKRDT